MRDCLQVSCAELDRLTECALQAGALGARLTGAGFGGCAIVFARRDELAGVRQRLVDWFYAGEASHVFEVVPSAGALAMAAGTSAVSSHP